MSTRKPAPSEEQIILAFASEPKHDRETLERYLREHPAHAEAIHDDADKRHHQRAHDMGGDDGGGEHAALPAELSTDGLEQHAEGEEDDRTVAYDQRQRRTEHDKPA